MGTVFVVTGHGETWVFDDEELAEEFANVRCGCEWETCDIFSHSEARALIAAEARQRHAEERYDRLRDEGRI